MEEMLKEDQKLIIHETTQSLITNDNERPGEKKNRMKQCVTVLQHQSISKYLLGSISFSQ